MKKRDESKRITEIDKLIGHRIRARRMELNLSQEALAKPLGVSFQQVQKYESGGNRITADRLLGIAAALEADVGYLIGGIENGKPPASSPLHTFLATREGMAISRAMLALSPKARRAVIELAVSLRSSLA
jgi:transcriptional regulator with XRE-family HTH domain